MKRVLVLLVASVLFGHAAPPIPDGSTAAQSARLEAAKTKALNDSFDFLQGIKDRFGKSDDPATKVLMERINIAVLTAQRDILIPAKTIDGVAAFESAYRASAKKLLNAEISRQNALIRACEQDAKKCVE